MGKSVGMLTGQAEPTIIQPPMYKKRFTAAMERYFMTVPVCALYTVHCMCSSVVV